MGKRAQINRDLEKQNRQIFFWAATIIALTWIAFYPVLSHDFLNWDDEDHVTKSRLIQSLDFDHLKGIFTSKVIKTYIPLTTLSFAVEYHFFKLKAFYYHFNNVFLHLEVAFLIFFFSRILGLSVRAAGLAALLFAVHPMHVESVAWISARKDVLYSVFYLLALISYWHYLDTGRKKFYGLSIALGLLSLLAKPMALSLPFVLLVLDWFHQRRDFPKMLLEKIPYSLYILPIAWVTYTANTNVIRSEGDWGQALLIFAWTSTFYIKQFMMPWNLSGLYETPEPISLSNPTYAVAALLWILCVFIMIRFRSNRWIIFAFMFYIGSSFFLWRVERLYNFSVVADRFMYLPSFGFCAMAGLYGDRFWQRVERETTWFRPVFIGCAAFVFAVLVIKTNLQTRIWKDSVTFWTDVIKTSPGLSISYSNRGTIFRNNLLIFQAIKDNTKAIELDKDSYASYYNRANNYFAIGEYDLALKDYTSAIKVAPEYPMAYNNRGIIYFFAKDYLRAIENYNAALRVDPNFADAYYNRGNANVFLGKTDLAIDDFTQAIIRQYDHWVAYINRASILQKMGRFDLAVEDYNKLIEHNPDWGEIYHERSKAYRGLKKYEKALDDALRAHLLGVKTDDQYLAQLRQLTRQ